MLVITTPHLLTKLLTKIAQTTKRKFLLRGIIGNLLNMQNESQIHAQKVQKKMEELEKNIRGIQTNQAHQSNSIYYEIKLREKLIPLVPLPRSRHF